MNQQAIQEIRAFNRFYTHFIGLLDRYLLHSKYTLPEVRVLYELYHMKNAKASDIVESLNMDKSYLSRVLHQFEKKKLIAKRISRIDKRSLHIQLTALGKNEFLALNKASDLQISGLLTGISKNDLSLLLQHMNGIKRLLEKNKNK
ncbi:MAG TPA: MarR family winged helix-turn-helix transcriptional regulator [Puia sp.]|nr:MarR family winged helix-turn-helix transcriptional regulator [Puia sp.]